MDLSRYVDSLRAEVVAAGAPGGPEVQRAAELVANALDSAVRLMLLDVLGDTADELTAALDGASVELRLRGREPELVVLPAALEPPPALPADDEGTARLTLRLPETLKARVETAAAADGASVNTWLVRAVSRALEPTPPLFGGGFPSGFPGSSGPRRITGFGRA